MHPLWKVGVPALITPNGERPFHQLASCPILARKARGRGYCACVQKFRPRRVGPLLFSAVVRLFGSCPLHSPKMLLLVSNTVLFICRACLCELISPFCTCDFYSCSVAILFHFSRLGEEFRNGPHLPTCITRKSYDGKS